MIRFPPVAITASALIFGMVCSSPTRKPRISLNIETSDSAADWRPSRRRAERRWARSRSLTPEMPGFRSSGGAHRRATTTA